MGTVLIRKFFSAGDESGGGVAIASVDYVNINPSTSSASVERSSSVEGAKERNEEQIVELSDLNKYRTKTLGTHAKNEQGKKLLRKPAGSILSSAMLQEPVGGESVLDLFEI
jgi:hypothetical protein